MINWNKQTQNKYRGQSVQNITEIKIGDMLYGRSGGKKIKEIITDKENSRRKGLSYSHPSDGNWIVFEGQNYFQSSLDLCIGTEYNPWMVFKDEEIAKAYYAELETWFDPDDDYFADDEESS